MIKDIGTEGLKADYEPMSSKLKQFNEGKCMIITDRPAMISLFDRCPPPAVRRPRTESTGPR